MSRVLLQPAGSREAHEHYIDTVENRISVERISRFVDEGVTVRLQELYKDGAVPVWGVTPSKGGGNQKKWERVNPGDVVLFSREKKIFASATVAFTIHNKELALDLWGTDSDEDTWEYVYFLDEVQGQNIPYEVFNRAVGYKDNFVIQGFNVLDEEKSQAVLNFFDLNSDTYYAPVSQEEYVDAISLDPSKSLEKEGIVKARTEQAFLRSALFRGKKFAVCGICIKEFPISFLVTAHIKKRASCTDEEKRDFKNIVMPMCKFGCDELYEKGYLSVQNGKVVVFARPDLTDAVRQYIVSLEGNKCLYWTAENVPYFSWHLENVRGKYS